MRKLTITFALVSLILNASYSQVSNTPPYSGPDHTTQEGQGLARKGKVVRYPGYAYPSNVMEEWHKKRGFVDPSTTTGLLSNPYRVDGTSLNYGLGVPSNFTGHVPVLTEGNYWPYIGPQQGDPGSYGNLEIDAGIYFQNGQVVSTSEPLLRKGLDRVTIVNKTSYGYLVSSGVFPGNEQPGQVMTIIHANGRAQLPIPPKDWWSMSNGQNLVPEVYSSVAGLNPLDAPGWKHSSWSPQYPGGVQGKDFGTGGFAYTFGSLYGANEYSNILFAGFHTNEGYDPLVSGDPGYGCAFYINGELQAVMDIQLTGTYTAQAILVAHQNHNPDVATNPFYNNERCNLKCILGVQPGQTAELHYITHDAAEALINSQSNAGGWKRVEMTYQSNSSASVGEVALPAIIPGEGGTTPTCNDGIQNGNETGVDCGGSCPACSTEPTCNDGIQNGDETGVDCGGSCPACSTEPTCNDGIQNGDETGVDCGGSCPNACGTAGTCGEFGFSYVDDNTIRIYHKDKGWSASWQYLCLDGYCVEGDKADGYYYKDFNATLGNQYKIQFKAEDNTRGQYLSPEETITFTKDQCSFVGGTEPTCNDGIKNGDETGVDCGGSCPDCQAAPTCNDGIQNGDETGVDCGGSCPACSTEPTCNDGIRNGDETGVDCGGSCPECSNSNYISGKFTPSNGRLLIIGQDINSIADYNSAFDKVPAGHSGYTSMNNLEGLSSACTDYGTGVHHAAGLASSYPNSTIAIGLYLVDQLDGINNGSLDNNMNTLIDELVALNKPVYLRFGYEFDGPWNHYEPGAFKSAWIKLHDRIKAKNAQNKIAMVWQSACYCSGTYNNHPIGAWYPGDQYVDLIGLSIFTAADCNYSAVDNMVNFARNHSKPVIVCESTPQGYDLSDNTVAPVMGSNVGQKSPVSADEIWNKWYQPFFNYIENNEDIIRGVTYINANWDSQGMWDHPYDQGYWGDSRVQANNTIKTKWTNEINKSDWIFASAGLFENLGFRSGGSTTPTCSDGIQNGDETGVDCGGSCAACTTTPTCNDGIQNGDETGVDCGGSCAACSGGNGTCDDFGMSYVDNETARVYHVDQNWSNPTNIYACVDGSCYQAKKQDGYYYYDFSSAITYGYVTMQLNKTYNVEFKLNHSGGYYTTGQQAITFTTESCSFTNTKHTQSESLTSLNNVKIYPNPVKDILYLEASSNAPNYEIYTIHGVKVLEGTESSIDVSNLKQGVYMIKVNESISKFMKQ